MKSGSLPISIDDVRAAQARIAPHAKTTPVLTSTTLDQLAGARLFFKCENFQRSGAFKIRGAANAVFSLDAAAAARGVVTHSSGNHGAALALAAQLRGIAAHIVIPEGASAAKIAAVTRYGARIIRCAPSLAGREAAVKQVLDETGGELVHPYNDTRVMAGQGTVAIEFLRDIPELDILVTPVSGGGLLSGCAIAATETKRGMRVIGAEPAGADDAARSLEAGVIVREPEPRTLCDGLRAFLGELTFPVIRQRVDAIATASDAETVAAMKLIWSTLKIVVEPSSAITLAAVLGRRFNHAPGARIGLILSGGNVDLDALPWPRPAP